MRRLLGAGWTPDTVIVLVIGERTYLDVEALAVETRRPVATIRARCYTVLVDPVSGRNLYDADESIDLLGQVPTRQRQRRLT